MAIFLDRDGVINVAVRGKWTDHEDDFELYPYTIEAMKILRGTGAPIFIVTNQSGVARGSLLHSQYYAITAKMLRLFEEHDIKITRVYECLHPKGEGTWCPCRKPGTGMLDRANHEYSFDHSNAWMVGDVSTDMLMAHNYNLNCEHNINMILVRSGLCNDETLAKVVDMAENSGQTIFIEENLLEAARRIQSSYSGSS